MFLSNPARYFVICTLFLAPATGCGNWQSSTVHSVRLAETEPPAVFPTKEPGTYRAEIVIMTGGTERRIFVARKGGNGRVDYDRGTPQQRTLIRSEIDKIYSERLSIYAELGREAYGPSELETDVAANLLASRPNTVYEDLGRENGLRKFRARSGESAASESTVFVDEAVGLPVRQEFYSLDAAGKKTLRYTMELRDVALEADDALFTVPPRARKVTPEEFTRATRQN